MATKHTHFDSTEFNTLRNSAIPAAIMASPNTRFDSAEEASVFFARELDHVKAKTYDVEYPELTALSNFPISSEADAGDNTITYYTYDKTGLAKVIDNYSTDLPRADVTGKPSIALIKSVGDSYETGRSPVQRFPQQRSAVEYYVCVCALELGQQPIRCSPALLNRGQPGLKFQKRIVMGHELALYCLKDVFRYRH